MVRGIHHHRTLRELIWRLRRRRAGETISPALRLTSVACGGGIQSSDVAGGRAFRWLGVLLTWAEAEASRALTWAVGGDGWGYC